MSDLNPGRWDCFDPVVGSEAGRLGVSNVRRLRSDDSRHLHAPVASTPGWRTGDCGYEEGQMGHSQADKAKTHERVLRIASRKVRENGLDQPGVAEIMEAAGLTHGGFYKHFGSREDLVAQAASRALSDGAARMEALAGPALTELIGAYLSKRHRDNPGTGCALVSLGSHVGYGDRALKRAYEKQVREYLTLFDKNAEGPDGESTSILTLSALVGAVLLARAVSDKRLSDEILQNVAEHLHQINTPPQ